MEKPAQQRGNRVRKRILNACTRCRQQKIKCSGSVPCQQCTRRSVQCVFDRRQQKVFVSRNYIAQLEHQIANLRDNPDREPASPDEDAEDFQAGAESDIAQNLQQPIDSINDVNPHVDVDVDVDVDGADVDAPAEDCSESESSHRNDLRATPEPGIRNPLDPSISDAFTLNTASRRYYLGVSSNWSFGRRVFGMVHEKTQNTPFSSSDLYFEGSTYDISWNGQRNLVKIDTNCLPAEDYAIFLINAVKFRCGGLFHMFDEPTFMAKFALFHQNASLKSDPDHVWLAHYLIILAFGKAFTTRSNKGSRPPGAELFIQAMHLLPDMTYLHNDALQAIEVLCCQALYLQCLDLRSAGYNVIGQAMRLALEQGMHTDMRSRHMAVGDVERCRNIWWTVFVLDRQMTSLMGVPVSLSDDDVTAPLPSFGGSQEKLLALSLHVQLAKAQATILQTVYGKSGGRSERFMSSMKDALKTIAEATGVRNDSFPIDLKNPTNAISRVSAYLHLFHHQSLILATRPLLFSFLEKRLDSSRRLRISSSLGARSLIRVCVSSALQCLSILEILLAQNLLETFIPFDLEATVSSALVLSITAAVDPSLVRGKTTRVEVADAVLVEMASQGNMIAEHHKRELDQLRTNLALLRETGMNPVSKGSQGPSAVSGETVGSYLESPESQGGGPTTRMNSGLDDIDNLLGEWNSEDGLTGEHLLAVANSFDFGQLDWPAMADIDPSLSMY